MAYKKIKQCEKCGKEIIARSSRKMFCDKCKKINKNEWKKEWLKNPENLNKHKMGLKIARKKYPETKRKIQLNYAKHNSQKIIAQQMAQKIPMNNFCQICGTNKNLERHHWRYDKPLMINTLCKSCHTIQHCVRRS